MKNKGFTLMELIIAIAVITTAVAALVALITFSVSGIRPGKSKLIAISLAQEGLEIVRNIRDSNWLAYKRSPDNWNEGLEAGEYRAQYDSISLFSFAGVPLKTNSNGFYQYDTGNNTPFFRKITITQPASNYIEVASEVTWQDKGKNQSVKAETKLYNWLEE